MNRQHYRGLTVFSLPSITDPEVLFTFAMTLESKYYLRNTAI